MGERRLVGGLGVVGGLHSSPSVSISKMSCVFRATPISFAASNATSCSPFISATGTASPRAASDRAPTEKSLVVMISPCTWIDGHGLAHDDSAYHDPGARRRGDHGRLGGIQRLNRTRMPTTSSGLRSVMGRRIPGPPRPFFLAAASPASWPIQADLTAKPVARPPPAFNQWPILGTGSPPLALQRTSPSNEGVPS